MATLTTLVSAPVTGISEANGINDRGDVVGQEDTVFPFVWQPSVPNGTVGTATRLGILPTGGAPGEATAFSINSTGDVVGVSDALDATGTLVTRAVIWASGSQVPFVLGTLIPDPLNPGAFLGNSRAIDINDRGLIVGASDSVTGVEHAFLFDPALGILRDLGSLVPLSMLPGTQDPSTAASINNAGDIVGTAAAVDAAGNIVNRAFLLPAGGFSMIDLGTLLPDPANPGSFLGDSFATGINDAGMITGTSDAGGGLTGVTQFFNGAPPVVMLPVQSDAADNGPSSHVVGSFNANPALGFVLHASTGLVDLTSLVAVAGTTVLRGTSVNALGQVTAVAEIGGSTVGVLITP